MIAGEKLPAQAAQKWRSCENKFLHARAVFSHKFRMHWKSSDALEDSARMEIPMKILFHSANIDIRIMEYEDIPFICKADKDERESNIAYLKRQLENQKKQECSALLALYNGEIAGYVFLYYKFKWGGLAHCNLPCIIDLIVFEKYRKNKIATALMDCAEKIAKQNSNKIYLNVCLNSEYGPAQRLYVKRGYVPDGKGVYYEQKVCETNAICKNDDELTLCLVKEL